jgi:hypothetical protein
VIYCADAVRALRKDVTEDKDFPQLREMPSVVHLSYFHHAIKMMHRQQAIGYFMSLKIIEKHNEDSHGREQQVEGVVAITNEQRLIFRLLLTDEAQCEQSSSE